MQALSRYEGERREYVTCCRGRMNKDNKFLVKTNACQGCSDWQ
ncbi:MAG: hypothetical protein WBB28_03700 [Crinalium sp.]